MSRPWSSALEFSTHERRIRTRRYDGDETTFGYDANGNRTSVQDGDGVATGYTYDASDRLATATTPLGTTSYDYWEDGLLKTTRYETALTETRAYDAASRLTVLEATGVSRFEYTFDGNGNRVRQVETRGGASETTDYGYDEADRLIGVGYPSETQLYGLDGVGNRTGEKRAAPGVVTALTVAAFVALTPAQATAAVERQHNAVDWLTAVVDVKGGVTTPLTHDANGNRTTEGTKAFSWDIRDTLTRVQDGATVLGTYDYDASLQRVKADSAQGHVEYVLDGKYVLRETGARTRRYHFSDGEALAVTGVGGGSSQDRWLLLDALGSVVSEANAAGGSVTARQFDAWGNYRNGTAPTANETRLGFTGHQFDVETGLTYARARYYDSKLGVMLSRDSFEGVLSDSPSLHRYAYAHANPLRYTDPSGRCSEDTQGMACVQEDAASAWESVKSAWNWAFPDSDAPTSPDSPKPIEVAPNPGLALVDYEAPSRQRMRFHQQWYRSLEEPTGQGGMSVMLNSDEAAALKERRNVEGTLYGSKVAAEATLELANEALKYEAPIALVRSGVRVVVESAEQGIAAAPHHLATRSIARFEADPALGIHPAAAQLEGLAAAESQLATRESVVRALRKAGTPEAAAAAKLIKREQVELRLFLRDPSGLRRGGVQPFGTNEIQVFGAKNATEAAGTAAHEIRHWLQANSSGNLPVPQLTPATYSRLHEYDAFLFQTRAGFTNMLESEVRPFVDSHRLYQSVKPK